MVGSHIKNLLGGIKGVWGLEWADAFFFFFLSFFFIFCGGGGGGSENVQEFHFAVARGGDFFFRG